MGIKRYVQVYDSDCDGTSYIRLGPAISVGHVAPPAASGGYYQGAPAPGYQPAGGAGYQQVGSVPVTPGGAGDISQVPAGGVMFAPAPGMTSALPAEPVIPPMQSTPVRRPTQAVFADQSALSQPTTPIAGSLMGQQVVSMPGTPNPIMVSTPNVSPGKGE